MADDNDEVDPEDLLAIQRAAIDQMEQNMPEFARLNWSIYSSHIEQGFPPEAALAVTQQFIAAFMASWGF